MKAGTSGGVKSNIGESEHGSKIVRVSIHSFQLCEKHKLTRNFQRINLSPNVLYLPLSWIQ